MVDPLLHRCCPQSPTARSTIQGQLAPRDDEERQKAIDLGHDLSKILNSRDLINSEDVFLSATGITDGELLRGVRHTSFGAISHSIVMRGESHTVRLIETEHNLRS